MNNNKVKSIPNSLLNCKKLAKVLNAVVFSHHPLFPH